MSSEGSVTRWVTALKGGDTAAAQPLWERYHRQLVSLARQKPPPTCLGIPIDSAITTRRRSSTKLSRSFLNR